MRIWKSRGIPPGNPKATRTSGRLTAAQSRVVLDFSHGVQQAILRRLDFLHQLRAEGSVFSQAILDQVVQDAIGSGRDHLGVRFHDRNTQQPVMGYRSLVL
jgi:hypothetical protein